MAAGQQIQHLRGYNMGALEDLAAMLAQGQAAASGPDVGKLIAQENPYLKLQQAPDFISQNLVKLSQDPNGTYKTRDLMIGGLLSGLLSGGLGSVGADYSNTLADRYQNVLQQAALGQTPQDNGDLSPTLFGAAKNQGQSVFSKNLLDKIKRGQDIQDAGLKKQAEIGGEQAAYNQLASGDTGSNPMNPVNKAKTDIENQARSEIKTSPLVQSFGDMQGNFNTMLDNFKFNDRPSTLAFISSFARTLDPGSTVKEGEIKNAENTQTFLSSLGYKLESLVNGTQPLDPKDKMAMIRASGAKYNDFGNQYSDYLQKQIQTVSSKGGKSENVFGPYDAKPFDFVAWANNPEATKQQTIGEQLGSAAIDAVNSMSKETLTTHLKDILSKGVTIDQLSPIDRAIIQKAREIAGSEQKNNQTMGTLWNLSSIGGGK